MKKLLVLILVFSLIFPALAWATEGEEPLPPTEETTNPAPNETPETTSYAIHLFDYVIVVVPGTTETPTTVGLFTSDTSGTPTEAISSYTVGGILGQAVSAVAQTVSPGPEHGKVVSAFVHQAVQARKQSREQTRTEEEADVRERTEEEKEIDKEERSEEKEVRKEQKRTEKEERKREREEERRQEDQEEDNEQD